MSKSAQRKNQAMIDLARVARITQKLYERQQFAYVIVDHSWRVLEASGNLSEFGFPELQVGADAPAQWDFLVGLNSHMTLDLPLMMSPGDHPVHIVLLPELESLTLVIMDASREYEQQQLVQQKANENTLLLQKQKRLTDELEVMHAALLEKNNALEEAALLQNRFISGVSHEFRTPLTSIAGYADLLQKNRVAQSKVENDRQLQAINRAALHLLSLVENLLDHGKLESGGLHINPQTIDLNELLNDVIAILSPLAKNKNIELKVVANPSALPHCFLDEMRVRQIILNIVGNAIKFTDVGSVELTVTLADQQLNMAVHDSGPGISEQDLEKVRHPFWQAPLAGKPGTGLGLTITDRIVELLGGTLRINSQVGVGTQVEVCLPTEVIAEEETLERKAKTPALMPLNILLVEDDPDISALLVLLLEEKQVNVTTAMNGQQAIEILEHRLFDLILMDLQMPVLDGYATAKHLREMGNVTPILIMTASTLDTDRSRAELLGCDGFLIKPVAVDELLILANQLVKSEFASSTETNQSK